MNPPSNGHNQTSGTTYEIRIECVLDSRWKDWFDGMSLTYQKNDETVLTGRLPDQAALYGVLMKIRDLGVPLISVKRIASG
jgi:hypothetical protein